MNYTSYLDKVEELIASMTPEQKNDWIMGEAMKQTPEEREAFLESLSGKREEQGMNIKQALKLCEEIETLDIHFSRKVDEEYTDYWSDNWTYRYMDNYGAGKKLDMLLEFVCQKVRTKEYKEALLTADRVLGIEFIIEDIRVGDQFEVNLEELFYDALIQFPKSDFLQEYVRGIYFSMTGDERCRRLMDTLKSPLWKKFSMEDVLIVCNLKREEINTFLDELIPWLGKESGDREYAILAEACLLRGGAQKLTAAALEYGGNYPALFVRCCEELRNDKKLEDCGLAAQAAVSRLDKKLVFRGRAAALGALALEEAGKKKEAVRLWAEAFWSESNVFNLLHLLNRNFSEQKLKVLLEKERIHIQNIPEKDTISAGNGPNGYLTYRSTEKQYGRNILSPKQKVIIKFFLMDAEESMEYCSRQEGHLGWSTEPQGVLVPLFLACLASNRQMTKAMRAVINRIAGRCDFKNIEEFWELLVRWRERYFTVDKEECLPWLEKEIIKRTDAVVGGGYRSSYSKAAELVAALDEIMADRHMRHRGETQEKIRAMHSRKSAFKQEIEELIN